METKTLTLPPRKKPLRDRRIHRRVEPPVSLRLSSFEERNCVPLNISRGGVGLQTARRYPVGKPFVLSVNLSLAGQIVLEGRVVWFSIHKGKNREELPYEIGVCFDDSASRNLTLLAVHL